MNQVFVLWQTLPGKLSSGYSLTCSIDFIEMTLKCAQRPFSSRQARKSKKGWPHSYIPCGRAYERGKVYAMSVYSPKIGKEVRKLSHGETLEQRKGASESNNSPGSVICHPHPWASYSLWMPNLPFLVTLLPKCSLRRLPENSTVQAKEFAWRQDHGVGKEGSKAFYPTVYSFLSSERLYF